MRSKPAILAAAWMGALASRVSREILESPMILPKIVTGYYHRPSLGRLPHQGEREMARRRRQVEALVKFIDDQDEKEAGDA